MIDLAVGLIIAVAVYGDTAGRVGQVVEKGSIISGLCRLRLFLGGYHILPADASSQFDLAASESSVVSRRR
ncbi:MAG: hypothetical protein OZ922_05455 [Myxococcales bacterium]|nr:hypothetical protein [Myxococcales bacterium]